MEFRIKNHKAYVNGGVPLSEWWTVQRLHVGTIWATAKRPVPYSIFNETLRFGTIKDAEGYIAEQLSKTKKFKVISQVL